MERIPDDLWFRIFELGTKNHTLNHTDICSLALTCHNFDQITQEPNLWAALLAQKSLSVSDQNASKALFRTEFEKMKQKEQEMEEMFDEVMEFVMWLDNKFLDADEMCTDDDTVMGYTAADKNLACADTSGTSRSISASAKSFWFTVSTVLLPKRHYQQACTSRLENQQI